VSLLAAGYFFGELPWVKLHLDKIIWALILVPGLIALASGWRAKRKAAEKAALH
jgi:membrane-associated protein